MLEKGEVQVGDPVKTPGAWHPVFLRDACPSPLCIDPSTTQKTFQTTDIPVDIKAKSVERQENGDVKVTWENDIPGFGPDHVSIYPAQFFKAQDTYVSRVRDRSDANIPRTWNQSRIREELQFINYNDYMNDDRQLFRALLMLNRYGLLLLRQVPNSEKSVEHIAGRIGPIRDTFYGRTWDVESVPNAKNVAYTHQSLGLHMDLQYMQNPPGFQFLHCLGNTCKGGDSVFSDTFYAASQLSPKDYKTLTQFNLAYHYRNGDEHYYQEHPVIETSQLAYTKKLPEHVWEKVPQFINYSPPFQANIPVSRMAQSAMIPLDAALRNFAKAVENPENLYQYRLGEGECVIFNNRRVLHGRSAFEAEKGQRWLKGAYVDTDVFKSKWRVMSKKMRDASMSKFGSPEQFAEHLKSKTEAAIAAGYSRGPDLRIEDLEIQFVHPEVGEQRRQERVAASFEEGAFGGVVDRSSTQAGVEN